MSETKTPGEKKLSVSSKTLTLKPRTETGVVRQSFSHGRSKQVVVEKVKRRVLGGQGEAKAEAAAERQRQADAEAERQRTGKKRRGKAPTPVEESPDDKAQSNFTDPELHIMRTNNKGWEYCGNAQASVDAAYQIILACDVTAETNDKQQAAPMAQLTMAHLEHAGMAMPTDDAGARRKIPATYDSGYYSEAAASSVEQMGFEPYMATGRQQHPLSRKPVPKHCRNSPPIWPPSRPSSVARPAERAWSATSRGC